MFKKKFSIPKIKFNLSIFKTKKISFANQKFKFYTTDSPSAAISVFEMFSIGLGPSSSHTVGPMRAAKKFAESLENKGLLEKTKRVNADLYGSLALTGEGHGTPKAILLGLSGEAPATVEIDSIRSKLADIWQQKRIPIMGKKMIRFEKSDLKFFMEKRLKYHSNGMEFAAFEDEEGQKEILRERYYSIGGGFFVSEEGFLTGDALAGKERKEPRFPFKSGSDLLRICSENNLKISDVARINESTWTPEDQIDQKLDQIWEVMNSSIERGMTTKGILPGGLSVVRRAPKLYDKIKMKPASSYPYDFVTIYAIAVNEENAAGGRVVTAPTNGASGIIPAVCKYYTMFVDNANQEGIRNYLLTSAIIGMLFKSGASISAAEVGCQGEVGVACSMAAGGLAEVLGGSVLQVENAAEIGMEHNLGLTCDPIGGLVQIPCIERNVMGSVKAITSARLALNEETRNVVSLDEVIATMAQTGKEMSTKYKETAQGGLAVNVTEC